MNFYRIYTEDLNRSLIEAILDKRFDNYTVIPTEGVYKRNHEHSLIIELYAPPSSQDSVIAVSEEIRVANKQDEVLISVMSPATLLNASSNVRG